MFYLFTESSNTFVELPPELCSIIMSPISITTFYSFSFVPSIMHRLESLLIAVNIKKMHLDHHCMQNDLIPTMKVHYPSYNCSSSGWQVRSWGAVHPFFYKNVLAPRVGGGRGSGDHNYWHPLLVKCFPWR